MKLVQAMMIPEIDEYIAEHWIDEDNPELLFSAMKSYILSLKTDAQKDIEIWQTWLNQSQDPAQSLQLQTSIAKKQGAIDMIDRFLNRFWY